jgi:predicted dienelactone hydrolase
MAPALGYLFDGAGLSKVSIPVRIYRPTADEILAHPWNAERIAQMLPKPPEYETIKGAGHYVFLAPCPPVLAARLGEYCKDPPGINRAALHARINADMVDFFRRSLASP